MGVNISVEFPYGTRIDDVATACAILLGDEVKWWTSGNAKWVKTNATLKALDGNRPQMAFIVLRPNPNNPAGKSVVKSDGKEYHLHYFFEGNTGRPSISPKCTAAKIAMGKALVRCFGGTIDYCDSDTVDVNFRAPANKDIHASDGAAWDRWQKRLADLQPLTQKDLDAVAMWAAY